MKPIDWLVVGLAILIGLLILTVASFSRPDLKAEIPSWIHSTGSDEQTCKAGGGCVLVTVKDADEDAKDAAKLLDVAKRCVAGKAI